jgi:hypothetical protein
VNRSHNLDDSPDPSTGIVIPSPKRTDLPELGNQTRFWSNLLANPELLGKTFFFNEAEYSEIRALEGKRHWLTGQMRLSVEDFGKGKRRTESYKVVIPVGGQRRAGMERCFREPLLSVAWKELTNRPNDFPNLRTVASPWALNGDVDVWWGDDISELFYAEKTVEVHRALGRAFGYREDCILRTYPDPWWKRLPKMWRR